MLIQKEREVCDLLGQLATELGKRREAQYQNIERERLVHEKDRQVSELQSEIAGLRSQQRIGTRIADHGSQQRTGTLQLMNEAEEGSSIVPSRQSAWKSSTQSLPIEVLTRSTLRASPWREQVGLHDAAAGAVRRPTSS